VLWGPPRHLGSLTDANWLSFDFDVSCSSCWGYSLINTLKFKKKSGDRSHSSGFRWSFKWEPLRGSNLYFVWWVISRNRSWCNMYQDDSWSNLSIQVVAAAQSGNASDSGAEGGGCGRGGAVTRLLRFTRVSKIGHAWLLASAVWSEVTSPERSVIQLRGTQLCANIALPVAQLYVYKWHVARVWIFKNHSCVWMIEHFIVRWKSAHSQTNASVKNQK